MIDRVPWVNALVQTVGTLQSLSLNLTLSFFYLSHTLTSLPSHTHSLSLNKLSHWINSLISPSFSISFSHSLIQYIILYLYLSVSLRPFTALNYFFTFNRVKLCKSQIKWDRVAIPELHIWIVEIFNNDRRPVNNTIWFKWQNSKDCLLLRKSIFFG